MYITKQWLAELMQKVFFVFQNIPIWLLKIKKKKKTVQFEFSHPAFYLLSLVKHVTWVKSMFAALKVLKSLLYLYSNTGYCQIVPEPLIIGNIENLVSNL